MFSQKTILFVVGVVILTGVGLALLAAQSRSSGVMLGDGETASLSENVARGEGVGAMDSGTYEPYAPEKLALAESGKVVLYFHADWCPICRGIEREIESDPAGIPSGVHILKIDYDTASALKQKYGVTYQHTFVQVGADGNRIAKWGDATTLSQVISRIR